MLPRVLSSRARLEAPLSALDKGRLKLPTANPRLLFDGFDRHPVTLTKLAVGPWSSPIADVITLVKIAQSIKPRRVLEVGSYRGYTTGLLAEHTSPDAALVAFDRDSRHGEAYRGTPLAARIERRIGDVSPAAFAADPPGSYDLIFLDADHLYGAVKHDTAVLITLLAPKSVLRCLYYPNRGSLSKKNSLPCFLRGLPRSLPDASLSGS